MTEKDRKSKIVQLGGIDAYQKASKLGEERSGGFNSAKWLKSLVKCTTCLCSTQLELE